MQACIYEEYGGADVVKLAEVSTPAPRPDEILVRVRASSVTTADWRFRASVFPPIFWLPGRLMIGLLRPRNPILGMDFSGVVAAAGEKVSRFRVGDHVFGSTNPSRRGAHAEYVAVSEASAVIHKPASLSDEEAAAIPFGANAALAFVRDFAMVRPGSRVLVLGASGGVGVWAIQLARHLGAVVTAVCSAANADLVRSLGAQHVIDYGARAFTQDGQTYDVILDTAGVTRFTECKRALSAQGVYVPLESGLREILEALATSRSAGRRVKFGISENTREGLETIVGLIAAGAVKPVIDRIYPMAEIAEAHRRVETRHKRGSVIIAMSSPRGAAASFKSSPRGTTASVTEASLTE